MERDCCEIKVTEMEKGFRIEITGDEVKEKCKTVIDECCGGGKTWAEMMKACKTACC